MASPIQWTWVWANSGLPVHFRTPPHDYSLDSSSPWTSPFGGAKLSNPFLWPQSSTSFPFSHSVSLCQLLLIPWPLTWLPFLPSPAWGWSHSRQHTRSLISTTQCPDPGDPVTSPIPNHSQAVRVCWKSCFPRWLCQQCFYARLVVSSCHAPRWLSNLHHSLTSLAATSALSGDTLLSTSIDCAMRMPPMPASVPLSILNSLFMSWYLFPPALEDKLVPLVEDHWSVHILNLLKPFPELGILHYFHAFLISLFLISSFFPTDTLKSSWLFGKKKKKQPYFKSIFPQILPSLSFYW